jgi:hypothetical protein
MQPAASATCSVQGIIAKCVAIEVFFHSGSDSCENLRVRQASIWLKNQTVEKLLCN